MSLEAKAFQEAVVDFNKANKVEGVRPFEGVTSLRPEVSMTSIGDQANLFVGGPLTDMRKSFQALLNSPSAHEFSEFFDHVREQCAKGEPLYAMLLGHEIT